VLVAALTVFVCLSNCNPAVISILRRLIPDEAYLKSNLPGLKGFDLNQVPGGYQLGVKWRLLPKKIPISKTGSILSPFNLELNVKSYSKFYYSSNSSLTGKPTITESTGVKATLQFSLTKVKTRFGDFDLKLGITLHKSSEQSCIVSRFSISIIDPLGERVIYSKDYSSFHWHNRGSMFEDPVFINSKELDKLISPDSDKPLKVSANMWFATKHQSKSIDLPSFTRIEAQSESKFQPPVIDEVNDVVSDSLRKRFDDYNTKNNGKESDSSYKIYEPIINIRVPKIVDQGILNRIKDKTFNDSKLEGNFSESGFRTAVEFILTQTLPKYISKNKIFSLISLSEVYQIQPLKCSLTRKLLEDVKESNIIDLIILSKEKGIKSEDIKTYLLSYLKMMSKSFDSNTWPDFMEELIVNLREL